MWIRPFSFYCLLNASVGVYVLLLDDYLYDMNNFSISVDEDEGGSAMDESGTTTGGGGGGGRGSSRTGGTGGMAGIPRANRDAMHIAQTLFPSTLCTAFVEVIGLLDDHAVSLDGTGVYEVAYQV